jgi:1-aminocyclopropane-1-carboxylate deaminase
MTREALQNTPKAHFLLGPSPIHPLPRLTEFLGGEVEVWAKREDLNSGMAYGGNKTRKLKYLAQDAVNQGCDTLVSIGASSPTTPGKWLLLRPGWG